jgi:hypothetical protein
VSWRHIVPTAFRGLFGRPKELEYAQAREILVRRINDEESDPQLAQAIALLAKSDKLQDEFAAALWQIAAFTLGPNWPPLREPGGIYAGLAHELSDFARDPSLAVRKQGRKLRQRLLARAKSGATPPGVEL